MILNKDTILAILIIFMLGTIPMAFADNSTDNGLTCCFFTKKWSKPAPSQAIFLPIGYHFGKTHDLNNEQWLFALNYHGFIGGTFINSANRRIYFGGLERQIYKGEKVTIEYILAIMQGYKGQGLEYLGPILGHDPGPLIALTGRWSLTDHFSINIATYGVGALAGMSYLF